MRKVILLTLCTVLLLSGCSSKSGESAEDSIGYIETESPVSTEWQDAYRKQLLEFMESEDYFEHSAFSIHDISGDGIPELIISQDTSHAASCFVYGYNGETILIKDIKGCYGTIGYYDDNNMVSVYDLHQGYELEGFYKIQDYQLVLKDKFFNDLGATEKGKEVYEYNNQQVSREKYEEALKNCRGEHGVELGTDYTFDEIDKAFEEYDKEIIIEENEWYKFYRYNNWFDSQKPLF